MNLDRVIKSWILKAEGDFAVGEHELSLPPGKMVTEAICFHSQQMAEKYLKAFLASRGAAINKTHNLLRILKACSGFDSDFTRVEIGKLPLYAVEVRYPGDSAIPSEEEAREAFENAKAIKNLVGKKLEITENEIKKWRDEFKDE